MYRVTEPRYTTSRRTPLSVSSPASRLLAVREQADLLRSDGEASPVPFEHVRDADEAGHELRRGPLVDLDRRPHLVDAAVAEDGDAVAHRQRLVLVVRHVDERDADVLLDALQLDLHLLAELEVEGAERLVEQQHARTVDERARERDALALAARELRRLARAELAAGERSRAPPPRALAAPPWARA